MYLARLILDPRLRSKRLRNDIRSPYEMHRTIMRTFPDGCAANGERVLWRLDIDRRSGRMVVYVQSRGEPDWTALSDEYPGYLAETPAVRADYPPPLSAGQLLSFRLRGNPTVRKKENGKRVGIIDEESQLAWLKRKGERGGFAIREASIVREDGPDRLEKGRKDDHKLSLLAVRFEGVLQVTDPEAFGKTLQDGIGSGKAMGFGLLSIAPYR